MKKINCMWLVVGSWLLLTTNDLLPTNYCYAQTDTTLSTITAVTTIGLTDYFPIQRDLSGTYTWRRITGQSMWDRITDTTEARITTLLNASNSWNGINNFDGATFNANAHGTVTFNDSTKMGSAALPFYTQRLYPLTTGGYIGTSSNPYTTMYANYFMIVNPTGAPGDTVQISYDGINIKFNAPITGEIDSLVVSTITANQSTYTIANITDSIITFDATNTSLVLLSTPGDVTSPGISKIADAYADIGKEVTIFNTSQTDTVLFKQYSAGDDNLFLAGNFYMGQNDVLVIQRVGILPGISWIEKSRSTNVNAP